MGYVDSLWLPLSGRVNGHDLFSAAEQGQPLNARMYGVGEPSPA